MSWQSDVRQIPKPKKMEGGIKSHTEVINQIGDGLKKVIEAAEKNTEADGGLIAGSMEVFKVNDGGESVEWRWVAEQVPDE